MSIDLRWGDLVAAGTRRASIKAAPDGWEAGNLLATAKPETDCWLSLAHSCLETCCCGCCCVAIVAAVTAAPAGKSKERASCMQSAPARD